MVDPRTWLGRLRTRAPVVPVVRLTGVIGGPSLRGGGLSLSSINPALERAFKLRGAKAVALAINSPGGSPVQSALIAGRIRALAAEKELPVLAFVEDVGASGGYWLALASD
jgi:serine protease SohB